MDSGIRVELVSHNLGAPLTVLAIKTSSGMVGEKGACYYLERYPKEKPEEVRRWLLAAAERFPSVLEHVVFTFMIEGISRVCSHQLVRHRIASYTQESQRYSESYLKRCLYVARNILVANHSLDPKYVDSLSRSQLLKLFLKLATDDEILAVASEAFVIPPVSEKMVAVARSYLKATQLYYELVDSNVPKEDARFVLPQAIKTRILMTVNLRELLHIACLRLRPEAQWEIRETVRRMVETVRKVISYIDELVSAYCKRWGGGGVG